MFGGHLDELLVELHGAFHLLGGDFELFAVPVVVLEAVHLHQQHVDEGVESGTLVDGILHQDGFYAGSGLDRLERGLEVCLVGIELVDDADDGLFEQTGVPGLDFAADLPSVLGVEEEYADVTDLECREEVSAEVVGSGAVDDVEFSVHEFGEENCGVDRAFVFVLDVRIVRERVVGLDTTPAVNDLPFVGHGFRKGSFTRARGTDKYNVLDLFG